MNPHTEGFSTFSSLFPLLSSLSSFSATMTMITRPIRLSLCTHGSGLSECQSAWTWAHSLLAELFASCKRQLSWHRCASLVPLGMKWACICAGSGCCVCDVFLFGCVWLCEHVLVCDNMCCLRCVVGWRRLLCGGDGSKKTKTTSAITGKYPAREFFPIQFYINSKKLKTALNYSHYSFMLIRKKKLHQVKSVIIFAGMVCCWPTCKDSSLRCALALRSHRVSLLPLPLPLLLLPVPPSSLSPYRSSLLPLEPCLPPFLPRPSTRPFINSFSTIPGSCSVRSFLACSPASFVSFPKRSHAHRRTTCRCSRPDHSVSFLHRAYRRSSEPLLLVRCRPSFH